MGKVWGRPVTEACQPLSHPRTMRGGHSWREYSVSTPRTSTEVTSGLPVMAVAARPSDVSPTMDAAVATSLSSIGGPTGTRLCLLQAWAVQAGAAWLPDRTWTGGGQDSLLHSIPVRMQARQQEE